MDFSQALPLIHEGLMQTLAPLSLLSVFAGVFFGVIIGALPGLGPVVGITIALPFTYSMMPSQAIALLLGIYCGAIYGGSISAILINTPGTPSSAATVIDGFPMAKQGKAGLALGWCTFASLFGGLFSCIVLIICGPTLAMVALSFGPVETFALVMLALTCIATVSRGSTLAGIVAGFIGLTMAVVGSDPISGNIRFSFGFFTLSGGIGFIPVVVGIFALSEVFSRASEYISSEPIQTVQYKGMVFPTWADIKMRIGILIKSSVIGTAVGILPGTGAATACFISYAEIKRSSPRRDKMGTGEPDGVIASEAANNAVTGGALVPTLALGLPGDAVTAVMLGTLVLHGITPGVRLMVDNPVTIYSAFFSLGIANVIMFFVGIFIAKIFAKLLKMPEPLLMCGVVILCLLGSYGVNSSIFDVSVTVIMGMFGFLLRRFKVPLAPLVIGIVLGPMLEINLRQGLILTDGSFVAFFVGHPIAVGLFIVTALVLGVPLLRHFAAMRKGMTGKTA